MNSTLLPDNLEINYRNNHYKHAQDVLNNIIWCSICNLDLKQKIIMNKKIMLHRKFLCLCCKNCFEKLSDSKNGCILCSLNTKLKTCEICNSSMCKRCIDSYYIKSKRSKNLKNCLGCSSSVLWSLRSQAAAVLKCFSLELDTRLLLNGEESENKQNLREFIIKSAICDENFSQEDIYQIRVFNLSNLLNSKIRSLLNRYQKLQTKNDEQCLINFEGLCEKILVDTCSLLFDSQFLFNDNIIESLNNKIKSIMINDMLLKTTENDSNKFFKDPHCRDNLIEHTEDKLLQKCSVLLEKMDKDIEKKYFLKKEYNINKPNNKGPFSYKNELMEIQTDQQENNLNLTFPINVNNVSQISLKECTVRLERLDEKILSHYVGQKYKNEDYNINKPTNKGPFNFKNELTETQTDQQENNLNLTIPINVNNVSQISLKECTVRLERLDEKILSHCIGQKYKDKTIKKTADKTKTKMKIIKKKNVLKNSSSKHKKMKRTKSTYY